MSYEFIANGEVPTPGDLTVASFSPRTEQPELTTGAHLTEGDTSSICGVQQTRRSPSQWIPKRRPSREARAQNVSCFLGDDGRGATRSETPHIGAIILLFRIPSSVLHPDVPHV